MNKIGHRRVLDVVIVGAGPAGIFAAKRILQSKKIGSVLILDKGKDPILRNHRLPEQGNDPWNVHDIVSGGGGAGLFSDGKLVLNSNAGGKLDEHIPKQLATSYIEYIDRTVHRLDGLSKLKIPDKSLQIKEMFQSSEGCDLNFKPLKVRHIGSQNLRSVLIRCFQELKRDPRCNVLFDTLVTDISKRKNWLVDTENRNGEMEEISAKKVILCVGKEGSNWLSDIVQKQGGGVTPNRTYFGVRIETETNKILGMKKLSHDPKLSIEFGDRTKIKTHCFCRNGEILPLKYDGLPLAGGHTWFTENNSEYNAEGFTNFGILLGDSSKTRFNYNDCRKYMEDVSAQTNGKLLVQKLSDFRDGLESRKSGISNVSKLSNNVRTGNLRKLELPFDFHEKLISFIDKLNGLDGVEIDGNASLYAPSIEWWMDKINISENMETQADGLYVAGDGAGFSQGIVYAAMTGMRVADEIICKFDTTS